MVEICQYCGWENQNNTNYCSSCGRPLKTEKQAREEKQLSINYNKLIIVSYIIVIGFSWGGLIFNILINRFGVGFFGFIGLVLPFYLIQSNNPTAKKHGYIQIIISLIGISISTIIILQIF